MTRRRIALLAAMSGAVTLAANATPSLAGFLPQTISFSDALPAGNNHDVGIAYDGTRYWSTSGGSTSSVDVASYTSTGATIATYSAGIDFRSTFTDGAGHIFGRGYASPTIFEQTTPGTFVAFATLVGGNLDAQERVVLNGAKTEYIGLNNGVVTRWSLTGALLGTVTLAGWGSVAGETSYPQNIGIASVGADYLTYSNGIMSTFDASGNRIDTNTLVGAGTTFDSNFSFAYTNGMAFVVDTTSTTWRGYAYNPVPEPASFLLLGIGGPAALVVARARRRKPLA